MRRVFAGMAAALLAAVLFFPCKVSAVSAKSAILLDAQTGRVIYEKNADSKSLIASTTKIMTALVICEQCNVLDRVRIPAEAVGIEGSSIYLQTGEILTVQDLLYGLMLHSGNDAAVALAIYCGGTVEGFAELMNDKARQLGMTNTHFVNPSGLDSPGHYSTARDLARLAAYAMKNPIFAQTVSTKMVKAGQRYLRNHNKLLWQVEGAEGVKTGYTRAAGRILVSSALRQGRRLVAVTINDPNDWQDHAELLESGFSKFKVRQIIQKGERLGTVQVMGGNGESVSLLAGKEFSYALAEEEQPKIILAEQGPIYAPICAGQVAGSAYVLIGDLVVGKLPLVYSETIEQSKTEEPSVWKKLLGKGTS